jgi:adenine-specific DNA-methyltransferase
MTVTKLHPTFTFDQERLDALLAIAPEAFADGQINWDVLKEALGEHLEEEGPAAEHFGLTWPGKRAARRLASQPSTGTLLPAPGEGVNETTTRNIFIEGDNLEVLKLLQKSYAGQVKMIYIDPPYNTGNDFVYKDDYSQPLEEYLQLTSQADEAGRVLTTNTKADGRFHSNWLSMMYPRLRLARNLLADDGVIFVSIDDNEVHNLRSLLGEVFGNENFVALIVAQTNPRGRTLDRFLAKTHEYIAVCAKDITQQALYQVPKDAKALAEYDKCDERGNYRELELRNRNPMFNRQNRPNLFFPFYADPATDTVSLEQSRQFIEKILPLNSKGEEGCWTWSPKKAAKNLDLLVARRVETGAWRVYRKEYIPEEGATTKEKALWLDKGINHENGKEELGRLFGKTPFDFPKSVHLLEKCLRLGMETDDEDIVLDFFAGSCTTAQALLELNQQDGGNRRFIMVQLPEPTPPDSQARRAGFSTIAEIGKERIRRVIKRMQGEQQKLIPDRETPEDLGFRILKLGCSHFKAWRDFEGGDVAELQTLFDRFESPLVDGWQPDDLLVEVMLLQGFPLDSTVTPLAGYRHNHVLRVTSGLVAHELYVCLDERLHPATADTLALGAEDVFVCLDSALDEETKLRLQDGRNVMVI